LETKSVFGMIAQRLLARRRPAAREGSPRWLGGLGLLLLVVSSLGLTGCGQPQATFSFNRLYLERKEQDTGQAYAPVQIQAIVDASAALFGSPDQPRVQQAEGMDQVLDLAKIVAAAGPLKSDNYGKGEGLYRQHCVHCHGITGNGRGPTAAFLNPYPRDFTRGVFKFTSTPIGYKPTHDDLLRILDNGIAGTAMPSFRLLSEGEREALIDYVKYLAIRGEVERRLIEGVVDFNLVPPKAEGEVDAAQAKAEAAKAEAELTEFQGPGYLVDEVLTEVVTSWLDADANVTPVPQRPEIYNRDSDQFDLAALHESEQRGRKLYYNTVANCFSCHGPVQLGDGELTNYDNWSKEFFDWTLKNDPNYQDKLERYVAITGLKPRNIRPRNLREGIYRGGRRPIDIFWRVHNGIDGTPMPAANKAALSNDDIWDLVNYVLSLPYEPASHQGVEIATNKREVN
jgi:mono/diheme cytochrome c family protein